MTTDTQTSETQGSKNCLGSRRLSIPGFSRYEIDTNGLIYKIGWRQMKQQFDKDGYRYTELSNDNLERKMCRTNRLVLRTFVREPLDAEIANHKDGNKANNKLLNLEWATQSQNVLHAIYVIKTRLPGASHMMLSDEQKIKIRRMIVAGFAVKQIARELKLSSTCLFRALKRNLTNIPDIHHG